MRGLDLATLRAPQLGRAPPPEPSAALGRARWCAQPVAPAAAEDEVDVLILGGEP